MQWKGRTFEVTGHRWNDAGWFVLAKDSKGSAVIPYMEVTDNQGMPLYEEQEFQSPDIVSNEQDQAGDAQFSRSADSVTGTPLSETDLDAVFNRVAPRLKNGNGYRIFDNVRDLFAAHPEIEQAARKQGSSGSDIEGVFHRGEILIVRNKITSEAQAEALMFHEATHGGVNAMMAFVDSCSTWNDWGYRTN